jgi:Galactose oxidase, central domain
MNRRRTTNRVTRLCSVVALITLLLAAAPPVQPLAHSAGATGLAPLAPLGTLRGADGAWTNQAPALPPARWYHVMASLGGDQVLLFGGATSGGRSDDTRVYDLSANTWTNMALVSSRSAAEWTAASPSARALHAMASLGGDQVLLFGGWDDPGGYDGDTWVYDLSANTWTNMAPAAAPSARFRHAMVYLGGDQVLLFGGVDAGGRDDETWLATGFHSGVWYQAYLPLLAK